MAKKSLEYDKVFRALGDVHRLHILDLLMEREMNAGELLTAVDVVQSTLSHHMKSLCESGLVAARKAGRWTYYSVNFEKIQAAREFLCRYTGEDGYNLHGQPGENGKPQKHLQKQAKEGESALQDQPGGNAGMQQEQAGKNAQVQREQAGRDAEMQQEQANINTEIPQEPETKQEPMPVLDVESEDIWGEDTQTAAYLYDEDDEEESAAPETVKTPSKKEKKANKEEKLKKKKEDNKKGDSKKDEKKKEEKKKDGKKKKNGKK